MRTRTPKYRNHVITAVSAAKLSIEMFNRVESNHSQQASLVFNAQAWELFSKGILIRGHKNIYNRDGTTITAEQAVNRLQHVLNLINSEENKTIQQVISLRNEALHGILPKIDQEIITHLLYYSLKTFHRLLKERFKSYFPSFDKNYLSIAFKEYTFYSHRVSKLFSKSKKFDSEDNRLLYLLDRAVEFAKNKSGAKAKDFKKWKEAIQRMPRKARIGRHLPIYEYLNKQEDVRFIPVQVSRGYQPVIEITKTKNPLAPVLIKKTDPNIDYPFFTADIAEKISKDRNFVARMARKLNIRGDSNYSTLIKTNRSGTGGLPKYNDKALSYIKDYLEKHPDFNPYKK